jgi:hypothetical protein
LKIGGLVNTLLSHPTSRDSRSWVDSGKAVIAPATQSLLWRGFCGCSVAGVQQESPPASPQSAAQIPG